jgi:hypothetical protein
VIAVIGGLHLSAKSDEVVDWTRAQRRRLGAGCAAVLQALEPAAAAPRHEGL